MPRTGRLLIDGGTYHVLTRGNNGQLVFHSDADFQRYLQLLTAAAQEHQLTVYHFALMPNHVHLVLGVARGKGLSKAMLSLNLTYALYYRKRHRYSGHLWQGRFKSLLINRDSHLLECGRDVELHPVRDGLAADPGAYPWSSYGIYADGLEHALVRANQHPLYAALGTSLSERQARYRQFLHDRLQSYSPHPFSHHSPATVSAPHLALSKGGWLGATTPTRPRGRPRKCLPQSPTLIHFPVLLSAVLSACCSVFDADMLFAQSSNGTYTIVQEDVISAGGQVGSGNPMSAQTALGLPASGQASNGTYTLLGGMGLAPAIAQPPVTMTVTVTGTVDDPAATVTVNNMPATILGSTFTAQGVPLTLGPNTLTAVAKDQLGNQRSRAITVYLDLPTAQKESRFNATVIGTVDDPSAQVDVNGVPATIASGQFTASVPLVSGYNKLTATALDLAGNKASASIGVFVPPPAQPPPMPTVGTMGPTIPTVTTQSQLTLGGTKTPGTSIWINGQQVYAADSGTTWSATITLTEGDNDLVIVARDATGAASAQATLTVVLDTLPPVVTFAPPAKTNFNPVLLKGSVDDHLTTLTVNGVAVGLNKRDFQFSLPLTLGPNALHLVAVSPNGYSTTRDYIITLGTIPTVQAVQPVDGTKLYAGSVTSIQVTATDQENDPIQYQILIDGTPLGNWSSSNVQTWTPGVSQRGLHTFTVSVRDDYGGSNAKTLEVFVVRPPINHP